jgi:hypothetical protein
MTPNDRPDQPSPLAFRASRRQLIAGAGAAVLAAGAAGAQTATDATDAPPTTDADGKPITAEFLFVQTSRHMAFDASQNRLTLRDVSPVTLFFTDRPDRIAGNMQTADFLPFWTEGNDSFQEDPPNADISIIEGDNLVQAVVVLRDPVLEGSDLHYTVQIIGGDMPVLGDNASLFIDIIGRPLTPVSFAGARRRAYRRAVLY